MASSTAAYTLVMDSSAPIPPNDSSGDHDANSGVNQPIATAAWYVRDARNQVIGPLNDFELREGVLVRRWGTGTSVSSSQTGPWTDQEEVRSVYLNLMKFGWYVRGLGDGNVAGPFTAEKMRMLAKADQLGNVEVRRGRLSSWVPSKEIESWNIRRPRLMPPESSGQSIQARCKCPHCWHEFEPDRVCWISTHTSLLGDPVIGPDAMRRFQASYFSADGDAVDAKNEVCSQPACPRCHLEIPRAVIELQPCFISVVGAPGAGKSYFLASAVEAIQERLARAMMMFRDAQVDLNTVLSEYRETLFWSDEPDAPVALPKTEPQGNLYQSVHLDGRDLWYAKPFTFRFLPMLEHPLYAKRATEGRLVCLYDNAGEHFLPGSNRSGGFATDHLRRSDAVIFLFDPTQHPQLRPQLRKVSSDPQLGAAGRKFSQAGVLDEIIERIRRRRGVAGTDRISIPLIVGVTKWDVWRKLMKSDLDLDTLPLSEKNGRPAIDMNAVREVSKQVRDWLQSACPEIINAAESQAEKGHLPSN